MFSWILKYLPLIAICAALAGCHVICPFQTNVPNDAGTSDDTGGDGSVDQGDDQAGGDEGADDQVGGAIGIRGRINPGQAAKSRPRMQEQEYPFTIVAQSNQTGAIYRAETSPDGDFSIDLPDSETGNSFVVTVLGPDGRAVGPVVMDQIDDGAATGLSVDREADLGTIDLPDDPTEAPITAGSDSDIADLVDPLLTARVDENGVPIGLASHGKGAEAQTQEQSEALVDTDQDGLIDIFDADDDGDGVVDDFDGGGDATGTPPDVHVNFFMNLKIQAEEAPVYYSGDADEIAAARAQDTVITFEVMTEPTATRSIVSAHLLETPGPAYLPIALKWADGSEPSLWADLGYAFDQQADRFYAFVIPNAAMDAGDSFTLEVEFDDGTTEHYTRMINYVFTNIPKLVEYGSPHNLTPFDVTDEEVDGSPTRPIRFDGTQDLVLVFNPPPDETGAPITGMNYTFQFFYHDVSMHQLNGQIDAEATWPMPIVNMQGTTYYVTAEELGELSEAGTYTVTLPKEAFPDTVVLQSSEEVAVTSYKIDITAEAPTGNAAIMLVFVKQ